MKNILNAKTITFFSACCLSASFVQADFREEVVKEWFDQKLIELKPKDYWGPNPNPKCVAKDAEYSKGVCYRWLWKWSMPEVMKNDCSFCKFVDSSIEALQSGLSQWKESAFQPKDITEALAERLKEKSDIVAVHIYPIKDYDSLVKVVFEKIQLIYQSFADKMNQLMKRLQEANQVASSSSQQKESLLAKWEEINTLLKEIDSLQETIKHISHFDDGNNRDDDGIPEWGDDDVFDAYGNFITDDMREAKRQKLISSRVSSRVKSSVVWENLQFAVSQISLVKEEKQASEKQYDVAGLDMNKVKFETPYGQKEVREKQVVACIKKQANLFQKKLLAWKESFFSKMMSTCTKKMDKTEEVFSNFWGSEDSDSEEESAKKVSNPSLVATCKKNLFQYDLGSLLDQQFSSLAAQFSGQLKSLKRENGIQIRRECRKAITDGQVEKWKSECNPVVAYMQACDEVLLCQAEMCDWIREREMQESGNDLEADRKKAKEWDQAYQAKVAEAQKAEKDFLKILDEDPNNYYTKQSVIGGCGNVLKRIEKVAEPLYNRLVDYGLLTKEEMKPADNQKEIAKDPFLVKKDVFSSPQPQSANSNVAPSGRVRRTKKTMEAFQQKEEENK